MAKDGTVRGGARIKSGPQSAANKKKEAPASDLLGISDLPEPEDLIAEQVPPVDDFLTELQKDGTKLEADTIFISTYRWIKSRGCEKIVPKPLINEYAMSVARWMQAEHYISKYGTLALHPTVKSPITSPYVTMSQNYVKQITNTWYQIYTIVRDNGSASGEIDEDDLFMEQLISSKLKQRKKET